METYDPIAGRKSCETVEEIRLLIDRDIMGTMRFSTKEMMVLIYALDKIGEICTELAGVRDSCINFFKLHGTPDFGDGFARLADTLDSLSSEAKEWKSDI